MLFILQGKTLRLREMKYFAHSKPGLIKEEEVNPRSLILEATLKPFCDIRLHILSHQRRIPRYPIELLDSSGKALNALV